MAKKNPKPQVSKNQVNNNAVPNPGNPSQGKPFPQIGNPSQSNQPVQPVQPQSNQGAAVPPAGNAGQSGASEKPKQQSGVRSRFEKTKSALTADRAEGLQENYLTHIDPVSAFKVGFVFNLAIFAIWVVAMVLLWIVLNVAGVWDRLNSLAGDLADGQFSAGLYFGVVFGLGLFELVIFTLLAPVAAIVFNSAASFFGGVRIGLAENRTTTAGTNPTSS